MACVQPALEIAVGLTVAWIAVGLALATVRSRAPRPLRALAADHARTKAAP
jgi:hypothetical protein